MIHGPCSQINLGPQCMNNGKCTKIRCTQPGDDIQNLDVGVHLMVVSLQKYVHE